MPRLFDLAFTLGLAVASVWHLGCAVTDYAQGPLEPPLNKSHGLITCEGDDHFANSQQTFELQTRELFYIHPEAGSSSAHRAGCEPSLSPTDIGVSRTDAREWNRFLGAFSHAAEFSVILSSGQTGTFLAAGIKDLPDGSRRINNLYYPTQTYGSARSCAVSGAGGREGGPEGLVVGEGWTQPGDSEPRLPGLRLDTVAIDSQPGYQWCENFVAIHPESELRFFSYYVAVPQRQDEWRLQSTPITRRSAANTAKLLFGGELTIPWEGVDVRIRAELQLDGNIGVELLGLSAKQAAYVAEKPLRFVIDPDSNFRRMSLDLRGRDDDLRRLARFGLDAGFADREITLGQHIPELALRLPDFALYIPGSGLEFVASGGWPVAAP